MDENTRSHTLTQPTQSTGPADKPPKDRRVWSVDETAEQLGISRAHAYDPTTEPEMWNLAPSDQLIRMCTGDPELLCCLFDRPHASVLRWLVHLARRLRQVDGCEASHVFVHTVSMRVRSRKRDVTGPIACVRVRPPSTPWCDAVSANGARIDVSRSEASGAGVPGAGHRVVDPERPSRSSAPTICTMCLHHPSHPGLCGLGDG